MLLLQTPAISVSWILAVKLSGNAVIAIPAIALVIGYSFPFLFHLHHCLQDKAGWYMAIQATQNWYFAL
ncbi:hypothetical protein [Peribacillus simplex]|uniref:hypothetical protein n=1 Tax=Peribacillus simplex TaxID=1478 RepID=UPI003D2A22E8